MTSDLASASTIIATYNGLHYLEDCLRSVLHELRPGDEVIVVDNASTDGGAELIQERFPSVTLIRNAENRGFAPACNQGAQAASGEILVFLNQDTRVEPGWLAALAGGLGGGSEASLVTSLLLLMSRTDRIQACGQDLHYTGLVFSRGFGSRSGAMNAPEPVAAVSGASFAIRRDLWLTLGGFDETFYMYYEETDLSWRAQMLGHSSWYVPGSAVHHDYRPFRPNPSRFYYTARNRYLMILRNWRLGTLLLLLPGLLLAELIDWYQAFAIGREGLRAKVRANLWLLGHLGQLRARRAAAQAGRTVSDADILSERTYDLTPVETALGRVGRAVLAICNVAFWLNYRIVLSLCQLLNW